MADRNAAVSVANTATRLDSTTKDRAKGRDSEIALYNAGAVTVYLGKSDVTTSTGVPLAAGAYWSETLDADSVLYGIVASGTCEVRVRETGI